MFVWTHTCKSTWRKHIYEISKRNRKPWCFNYFWLRGWKDRVCLYAIYLSVLAVSFKCTLHSAGELLKYQNYWSWSLGSLIALSLGLSPGVLSFNKNPRSFFLIQIIHKPHFGNIIENKNAMIGQQQTGIDFHTDLDIDVDKFSILWKYMLVILFFKEINSMYFYEYCHLFFFTIFMTSYQLFVTSYPQMEIKL